jgi:hypothetical protein
MIVFAATRKDGVVGYFKTAADVPPEFKHPGEENISGVMKSMQLTSVERTLEIMNQHWQSPVLGPRLPENSGVPTNG